MQDDLAANPAETTEAGAAPTPDPTPPEIDPSANADPEGQPPALPDEDLEEGEFNGVKARYPKAWKDAFMMQADYTKKTMAVAETTKAIEARDRQLQENAAAIRQDMQEHAELWNLNTTLEQFEKLDWDRLLDENPIEHDRLFRQYTFAANRREQLKSLLQGKHAERTRTAAEAQAKLVAESRRTLAKEIPNWNPKTEHDLTAFAGTFGFTSDQVKETMDTNPAAVRILHLAYLGHQLQQQQRRAAPASPPAEPAKQVGGTRSAPSSAAPSDRDGIDAWMKKRNKQTAA